MSYLAFQSPKVVEFLRWPKVNMLFVMGNDVVLLYYRAKQKQLEKEARQRSAEMKQKSESSLTFHSLVSEFITKS